MAMPLFELLEEIQADRLQKPRVASSILTVVAGLMVVFSVSGQSSSPLVNQYLPVAVFVLIFLAWRLTPQKDVSCHGERLVLEYVTKYNEQPEERETFFVGLNMLETSRYAVGAILKVYHQDIAREYSAYLTTRGRTVSVPVRRNIPVDCSSGGPACMRTQSASLSGQIYPLPVERHGNRIVPHVNRVVH